MKNISLTPQKINRANSLTSLLALGGLLGLMAGCASAPESHLVVAPPPSGPVVPPMAMMASLDPIPISLLATSATDATIAPQPVGDVVVIQAPPALMTEVILAQPSPDQAWIAGYWTWQRDRYQWMAGHWEVRPSADARWMSPRWETENGAYRFHAGYWN